MKPMNCEELLLELRKVLQVREGEPILDRATLLMEQGPHDAEIDRVREETIRQYEATFLQQKEKLKLRLGEAFLALLEPNGKLDLVAHQLGLTEEEALQALEGAVRFARMSGLSVEQARERLLKMGEREIRLTGTTGREMESKDAPRHAREARLLAFKEIAEFVNHSNLHGGSPCVVCRIFDMIENFRLAEESK